MLFCNSTIKSSLAQDLSSNISRFNNLQAALRTWLDHLNRLASMSQAFQSKYTELEMNLTSISDQLNELRVPTRFSELRNHIHKLKVGVYLLFGLFLEVFNNRVLSNFLPHSGASRASLYIQSWTGRDAEYLGRNESRHQSC